MAKVHCPVPTASGEDADKLKTVPTQTVSSGVVMFATVGFSLRVIVTWSKVNPQLPELISHVKVVGPGGRFETVAVGELAGTTVTPTGALHEPDPDAATFA